jgi:hypothetical protein
LLEYDLVRLFEHPLSFWRYLPGAIVAFGGNLAGQFRIKVQWKSAASAPADVAQLVLKWNTASLKSHCAEIEVQIANLRDRSEDKGQITEDGAIIVAVAVMSVLEPGTLFTHWPRIGLGHDFYLNHTRDEMIEVKGRWEGGLPGLAADARQQSDQNPTLRKRWISVTVFSETARNRTEGLHP